MNEFDLPSVDLPVANDASPVPTPQPHVVDPVRAAAGRLGAQRVHELTELGRQYEREHGLTPGRQRLRQLIQLGKRHEQERGLRIARPRRQTSGDAWLEFLVALARVVKPTHRPAVEKLVAALRSESAVEVHKEENEPEDESLQNQPAA